MDPPHHRENAAELTVLDIRVCPNTVARLLKKLQYALRVNHKRVAKGSGPDRNEQFEYIATQRTCFASHKLPIVSIDTKKKELVGNFKNPAAAWTRRPHSVRDHDFRSEAEGMAIPHGIYDLCANRGAVFVGTSHDTPEFAADNLARWWRSEGRRRYPRAARILVLADGGGSNGPRCRAFKYALQHRLATPYGLAVTVCHYPAGASKWNPIEHRLFSEISKNWAGQPLRTYDSILNYIRTTRTRTGLRVTARLIKQPYPTGVKITNQQIASISLEPHDIQSKRNYTIHPADLRS